jgi:hypothetical protein
VDLARKRLCGWTKKCCKYDTIKRIAFPRIASPSSPSQWPHHPVIYHLQRSNQSNYHPANGVIHLRLLKKANGLPPPLLPTSAVVIGLSFQGLDVKDIAEIRPGTHSIGFVRSNSTDKQGEVDQPSLSTAPLITLPSSPSVVSVADWHRVHH